jgi:hypothetical protein
MNSEQILDQTEIKITNHHFNLTINTLNENTRPLFKKCSEILLKEQKIERKNNETNTESDTHYDYLEKIAEQELKKDKKTKDQLTILTRQKNTPLYKEAIQYYEKHLPKEFTKKEFIKTLQQFYHTQVKLPKLLKKSTIETYSSAYKTYFYDHDLIELINFDKYRKKTNFNIINENTKKTRSVPMNTSLFLNWIENNNIKKFTIHDFIKEYPYITHDQATKIMSHQIQNNTIWQNDKETFTVTKKVNT